jgi:hypothetical protein
MDGPVEVCVPEVSALCAAHLRLPLQRSGVIVMADAHVSFSPPTPYMEIHAKALLSTWILVTAARVSYIYLIMWHQINI